MLWHPTGSYILRVVGYSLNESQLSRAGDHHELFSQIISSEIYSMG